MSWKIDGLTPQEERERDRRKGAAMSTATEKQAPHTTTHDRYQISDPICGLVETATSLEKALRLAKAHPCEGVVVFDVMARPSCAQVWDKDGNIIEFRNDRLVQPPEPQPTTVSEKQPPAKWAMDTAQSLRNNGAINPTWSNFPISSAAQIIERESPVGKLTEAIKAMFKAADEIAAEYIAQKRAANWGIVNNAYMDAERVLRELGVEL